MILLPYKMKSIRFNETFCLFFLQQMQINYYRKSFLLSHHIKPFLKNIHSLFYPLVHFPFTIAYTQIDTHSLSFLKFFSIILVRTIYNLVFFVSSFAEATIKRVNVFSILFFDGINRSQRLQCYTYARASFRSLRILRNFAIAFTREFLEVTIKLFAHAKYSLRIFLTKNKSFLYLYIQKYKVRKRVERQSHSNRWISKSLDELGKKSKFRIKISTMKHKKFNKII